MLVVSPYPPRRCGIGVYARDQVLDMREAGNAVTVLSPPDGDGDVRVAFEGGEALRAAARRGGRFDRIVVHFQPALYYRPRAAVSKVLTSLSLLWLVLRRRQTEIVVHEADPPVRWRPDYLVLGLAFRAAPLLLFHTAAERRNLEAAYRVRVRWALVPHRVRPAAGRADRDLARRELGVGGDPPVFVCPGFIQPSKGQDRAVEAFAQAFGDGRPGSLYLVGSVREESGANLTFARELRARCRTVPRAHLVERFVGDQEFDMWVAAADRLVLPYRRSWSSGVLARAHALGTPAIVTREGGLPEQAGKDDVVVSDDEELAKAMREAALSEGGA